MAEKDVFEYTYSAPEPSEIQIIRQKYLPRERSKRAPQRTQDESATKGGVVDMYQKIESGVVSGYKKIEQAALSGFGKLTDKFVQTFFAREGESVEEAKQRLSRNEPKD